MPYCGTTWVAPGTTTCPNGDKPTAVPAGATPAPGAVGGSNVTAPEPTYMYNQDTTPVQVGSTKKQSGGYSGIPSGTYMAPNMTNVTDARNTFNEIWGAGSAKNASKEDKAALNGLIANLRKYTGSELGTRGAVEDAWADALKDASRSGVDVFDLIGGRNPASTEGGSTGSGRGGYSGPTASVTYMDDRDVDRTANALALELIGRPLSDKELAKVTKRLRKEETANPTISTPGVGSSVTQAGLSAEGRQDVLREVIAENPEYQQFQVDTTVLDAMLTGLKKREQMVNG